MLPSEEREVMVLSILGVSTESVDASEPSIAGICNVDPRTVRNRLKRAREKLAYLKELTS
jgi:DNA-directed RNA polymerase specialized sigma24 family protein